MCLAVLNRASSSQEATQLRFLALFNLRSKLRSLWVCGPIDGRGAGEEWLRDAYLGRRYADWIKSSWGSFPGILQSASFDRLLGIDTFTIAGFAVSLSISSILNWRITRHVYKIFGQIDCSLLLDPRQRSWNILAVVTPQKHIQMRPSLGFISSMTLFL